MEVNKLYHGNCLDHMKDMQDGFIDLTVTSPPYDKLRDYKGYKFPFKHIARHLYRVTKFGGVVVWVVGDATVNGSETGTSFRQALFFMECGFRLHDTMIYKDEGLTMNHNRYEQEWEFMYVFSKGRPTIFNPIKIQCKYFGKDSDRTGQITGLHEEKSKRLRSGIRRTNILPTKIKGNVWEYGNGFNKSTLDEIAFSHVAVMPEKLAADHIKSWSNEGDLIYDPFAGSGTTLKMAHLLKRNWIGSEISKEYCELSEKRLAPYLQQIQIF